MKTSVAELETPGPLEKYSDLPGGTETVLLVDDDPALLVLGGMILRDLGYRVLEAMSGAAALEIASTTANERIDLLITDVVMSNMNGKALAERLQVSHPAAKVLLVSGLEEEAIVNPDVLVADFNFLHKPFTPGDLARRVREALGDARAVASGPTKASF